MLVPDDSKMALDHRSVFNIQASKGYTKVVQSINKAEDLGQAS